MADITAYGTTSEGKATYLRGNGLVYAKIGDSGHYFYKKNAHGDVVQYLNVKGNPDHTYKYSAFGVELSSESPTKNPFRYCGEYFDTENGSIYLRARHYVPGVGRFTQEDTVRSVSRAMPNGQNLVDSLTLNLYTYCANDPIRYLDSSGNIFFVVAVPAAYVAEALFVALCGAAVIYGSGIAYDVIVNRPNTAYDEVIVVRGTEELMWDLVLRGGRALGSAIFETDVARTPLTCQRQ